MNIIEVADEVVSALAGKETNLTGLNMLAAIKRMEAALAFLYKEYIGEANKEFATLCSDNPEAKTYQLPNGSVKRYTKSATYAYSDVVTSLEAQAAMLSKRIADAKEFERKDGIAKKVEAVINTEKDCTFAISVFAEKYPLAAIKEVDKA